MHASTPLTVSAKSVKVPFPLTFCVQSIPCRMSNPKKLLRWYTVIPIVVFIFYGSYGVCFGRLALKGSQPRGLFGTPLSSSIVQLEGTSARFAGAALVLFFCGLGLLLAGADTRKENLVKVGLAAMAASPVVLLYGLIAY